MPGLWSGADDDRTRGRESAWSEAAGKPADEAQMQKVRIEGRPNDRAAADLGVA